MKILLDTSAYAGLMRGHRDIAAVIQRSDEIRVNVVVLGELRSGFLKGKYRKKNERELETFLASPRVGILTLDEDTAERYAIILNALWKAGTPIPINDIWIAASAMQHGLRVLTSDIHYQKVPHIVVESFPVSSCPSRLF